MFAKTELNDLNNELNGLSILRIYKDIFVFITLCLLHTCTQR